jgi:GR25 family glycosyltransferase involved in LPS biosynthesis
MNFTILSVSDRFKNISAKNKKILFDWNYVPIDSFNAHKDDYVKKLEDIGVADTWVYAHPRSPGHFGCFISHYNAWKYIIDNNLPYLIVLEDDALLTKAFQKTIKEILEAAGNEYDFISLWAKNQTSYVRDNVIVRSKKTQNSDGQFSNTAAMIYSNSGSKKMIKLFKKKGLYSNLDDMIYDFSSKDLLIGFTYNNIDGDIVINVDRDRLKSEIFNR